MRKMRIFLAFLVLPAVLLAAAPQARPAMWVGVELGPNFVGSTDLEFQSPAGAAKYPNVNVDPALMGGVTLGYHFIKEGALGYSWPDWMKYFQVALDVSFHRLVWSGQGHPVHFNGQKLALAKDAAMEPINGSMLTVAIPIMVCYGFYPDPEVPFGRLVPYLGVGPAFFATWASTSSLGGFQSFDVGLLVEAGVRYMALKNVSLDLAFRYRNPLSAFGFEHGDNRINFSRQSTNLFNALVRASYHF